MKLFKISLMSNFTYQVPEDKEQLIYDFYAVTNLSGGMLPGFPEPLHASFRRHEETLEFIRKEIMNQLCDYLIPHLKDALLLSISAEFRHIFDFNTGNDLDYYFKQHKLIGFLKRYRKKYNKNYDEEVLGDDLFDSTEYRKSQQAITTSINNIEDFFFIAQKCFEDLAWADSFGGKPWAEIAEAAQMLYKIKDNDELMKKIAVIDHIYHLQHNTDSVFNKLGDYYKNDGHAWIKKGLDFRADLSNFYLLIDRCSSGLKPFLYALIHDMYGTSSETFDMNQQKWKINKMDNLIEACKRDDFSSVTITKKERDELLELLDNDDTGKNDEFIVAMSQYIEKFGQYPYWLKSWMDKQMLINNKLFLNAFIAFVERNGLDYAVIHGSGELTNWLAAKMMYPTEEIKELFYRLFPKYRLSIPGIQNFINSQIRKNSTDNRFENMVLVLLESEYRNIPVSSMSLIGDHLHKYPLWQEFVIKFMRKNKYVPICGIKWMQMEFNHENPDERLVKAIQTIPELRENGYIFESPWYKKHYPKISEINKEPEWKWEHDLYIDEDDSYENVNSKSWYKMYKNSYSTENAMLRDYLRTNFNYSDFSQFIISFLKERDEYIEEYSDMEDYEILENWWDNATSFEQKDFKEYCLEENQGEVDSPPYLSMDYKEYVKPQWLIHFTNDADSIAENGFLIGHDEMYYGLHLTTYFKKRKGPGYNFAFQTGTRDASFAAMNSKYGNEAVVFWGDGVEIYHPGDEEKQIIFWGPSINKNMIFPIKKDGSEWTVHNEVNGNAIVSGELEKICTWIENNYRMLQNIRKKTNKGYFQNIQKNK